ncbi:PREDICTED: protein FAM24A isoform X2 [Condylura cristata]|uniref:protein FAM24A isoform X2 n=1 Tax=Condylura cristata TaxID=143302 RepID=UPI000642F821|nr:PREDICTED: protein FAM24A isoform X2 [Condylura cristata]
MMNFNVMVVIGSTLLVLLFLLLCAVICLYCKVANALKPPKLSGCLALTNTQAAYVAEDKVTGSSSITACYPTLQTCDQCNLYADVDPLLSCLCDVNEGTCEVSETACDANEGL